MVNNRWRHHAMLACISAVIYLLVNILVDETTMLDKLSLATAYVCLLLMVAALSIGPLNARRLIVLPVNIYLRRDVGIWSASAGLTHLVVATGLTMNSQYMDTYVHISAHDLSERHRASLFIWGTVTAYAAGLLLLLLLGLSNNRVMHYLGTTRWKCLQRSAYMAFLLITIHAFSFQFIESRHLLLTTLLSVLLLFLLALQIYGYISIARRRGSKNDLHHHVS